MSRTSTVHGRESGPFHRPLTAYVCWTLLILSVVAWRQGEFFDGGVDVVVAGKAALVVFVLLLAAAAHRHAPEHQPVGGGSFFALTMFVGIATIGGYAGGTGTASAVLGIRILLIAAAIVLLLRSFPPALALKSLMASLGFVGLIAAVSGIGSLLMGERLTGQMPPLSPNEISMLCGLPSIAMLHELILGRPKRSHLVWFLLLLAVVWATGSRTAIVAIAVSAIIILAHARQLRPAVASIIIALVPVVFVLLSYTPLVTDIFVREDGASITTLNSRTIAWAAVFNTPNDTWERWIGSGLSIKQVPVAGQYWNEQVFDSSWVSALAQAGIIGTVLMAIWVLVTLAASLRLDHLRALTTAALAFILIRSFLENGLIESSTIFVVFFAIAVLVQRPGRAALNTANRPPHLSRV